VYCTLFITFRNQNDSLDPFARLLFCSPLLFVFFFPIRKHVDNGRLFGLHYSNLLLAQVTSHSLLMIWHLSSLFCPGGSLLSPFFFFLRVILESLPGRLSWTGWHPSLRKAGAGPFLFLFTFTLLQTGVLCWDFNLFLSCPLLFSLSCFKIWSPACAFLFPCHLFIVKFLWYRVYAGKGAFFPCFGNILTSAFHLSWRQSGSFFFPLPLYVGTVEGRFIILLWRGASIT